MKRVLHETVYGHGLSFYATLAFMIAFFGARSFAVLNPTVVVISGQVHFHHFWYGLGMVTAAGWLGIAFSNQRLLRTYALVFGLGAGLIADEVGLLLTFGDYQSQLTTDFFVGTIGFIILATMVTKYKKIIAKDVIHISWNERLIYVGISLVGLSTLFFALNSIVLGFVTAGLGFIAILSAFEAAKAGMLAGVAGGGILAVGQFVAFQLPGGIREEIQSSPLPPDSSFTVEQLVTLALIVVLLAAILEGIIGGALLGLVFSAVNARFMKNYDVRIKALVFGLALWILSISTGIPSETSGVIFLSSTVAVGLMASLVYGYLLGTLFPRFRRKVATG